MSSTSKNILLFNPSYSVGFMYLPYFWASAKTYYEHVGKKKDEYNWVNPLFNFYSDIGEIKQFIRDNPPAVFGISLYVWNHTLALKIAAWVKEEFPDCIVISGGPHQYFKHELTWFQDNPFLDASLAGDEYGELTMCDILDSHETGKRMNWNQVHAVIYPSKDRKIIMQSRKTANKREFWWEYSAYANQFQELLLYRNNLQKYNPAYKPNGMLETTRGCPYNCSFCDWGGGISTKIVARDLTYVKQDIDYLAKLNLDGVFFTDANFGILKDRDVEVMQYIADVKKNYDRFFSLNQGGYAKTAHALPYIKKIVEIEAQNYLTRALTYKLSIQTLDPETLKNIDRVDVKFEEYMELGENLLNKYGYDAFAEIIAGLPGITSDKFYHELNVFCNNNISMNFYDWYVLPETPSYSKAYREKFKLKTVKKMFGITEENNNYNSGFERESEIVISTYSYTVEDYKQMWISYAWYRTFWTAGFLHDTISSLKKHYGLSMGDFVKKFYNEFFTVPETAGSFLTDLNLNISAVFDSYVEEGNTKSNFLITTDYIPNADPVKLITFTVYMRLAQFDKNLINWIHSEWPQLSIKEIQKDIDRTITNDNFKTKTGIIPKLYYYNDVFVDATEITEIKKTLSVYLSSSLPVPPLRFLRAKTVLF